MLIKIKKFLFSKDSSFRTRVCVLLCLTVFFAGLSILMAVIFHPVIGICFSSVTFGIAMFFLVKMFNTQQIKAEAATHEAIKSSLAKGIFLANMSHEIRTPINVILGINEMINRSGDPQEIHEYTSMIKSSGDHLLSIVNNIMDITQIESGRVVSSPKPYRTDSLFSDLISIGDELCERNGLNFESNISPDMASILEGDKDHLRQIIMNFISNAVKYTKDGSVTLSADTKISDSDAVLTITVSDTGIGIPEKELNQIFTVFNRGNNAIEAAVEGTGLGLAIVKSLSDSMGGKLIVESKEGQGSTFGIEVSQKVRDPSPVGDISLNHNEKNSSDSFIAPECHILAVDDNTENLRVIKMLLERTMVTVDTALDGYKAVDMVSKNDYDLIFLDYMMPDLDGIETLRKMREAGVPEDIPIVALTAEALSGSEDKFLSAGFDAYLSKPVSWHDLEKTLISLLPKDKITISISSEDILSESELEELTSVLANYDIDLVSGINFLSGNITRFGSLAEIYVDGYEHNHNKVRKMFEESDEGLSFEVHSLKSASKGIGALTLFEQAAELEKRLGQKDLSYVKNAKDLFLFEWKRVSEGLKLLISELSAKKKESASLNQDNDNLEEQIEKGLEEHIWVETLNAIRQLIDIETDPERKKNLTYIAEFVDELDFESAQSLFRQLRRVENE